MMINQGMALVMLRTLAGAFVLAALSACAGADAPRAAQEQCFRSTDQGVTWASFPDASDKETCFSLDRCIDGVAQGKACTKWARAANAPGRSWVELGFGPFAPPSPAVAAAPTPACYLKSDDDTVWKAFSAQNEAHCFAEDACNGGLGNRPNVCTKWAMSADAPALPWSAALTKPQPTRDIPPPPEVVRENTDCLKRACPSRRLVLETPLLAQPDTRAAVVGAIAAGECVRPGASRLFNGPPRRGVVLADSEPFAAGDVIYVPGYADGDYTIWWRGAWRTGIYSPLSVVVRWDPEVSDPRIGDWVEYTRANGQRGWARNAEVSDEACAPFRR